MLEPALSSTMADSNPPPSFSSDQIKKAKSGWKTASNDFIKFFEQPKNTIIDKVKFELKALTFVRDHSDKIEEFKKLLETEAEDPTPEAVVDPDEMFMDRVRDALCNDHYTYKAWLNNLLKYINGLMSFEEFKRKVSPLFTAHPELLKDLPKFDKEHSTSNETEGSSSEATSSSKRRKTD